MFRFPIAAVIGLTATLSAAHADTIIYQGTPSLEPLIISGGDVISRGELPVLPGVSHSILNDPAFHRLAEMCDTLGMACGANHVTPLGGIAPAWTPGHRADAEKRLAQMIEEREAYALTLEDHVEVLPVPTVPRFNFSWNTPYGAPYVPYIAPRPRAVPDSFSHLLPSRPHLTLPRPGSAHTPDLSGFFHRLNTPGAAVLPNGFPHRVLPRHTFPWHTF